MLVRVEYPPFGGVGGAALAHVAGAPRAVRTGVALELLVHSGGVVGRRACLRCLAHLRIQALSAQVIVARPFGRPRAELGVERGFDPT